MNEMARKSWRTMVLTGMIIGGLVMVNVAFLFSTGISDVHIMQWVYTLSPRTWPVWYAWNFWILATGIGLYLLSKKYELGKTSTYVLAGTWLFVGLIFFTCSFFCKMLRIQAYYLLTWCLNIPYEYFYKPFVSIPLTEFSATGTISWKLLILPLIGIAGVAFLIRWGKKRKSKRNISHEVSHDQ